MRCISPVINTSPKSISVTNYRNCIVLDMYDGYTKSSLFFDSVRTKIERNLFMVMRCCVGGFSGGSLIDINTCISYVQCTLQWHSAISHQYFQCTQFITPDLFFERDSFAFCVSIHLSVSVSVCLSVWLSVFINIKTKLNKNYPAFGKLCSVKCTYTIVY